MPYLGGHSYQGGIGGFLGNLAGRLTRGAIGLTTGGPLGAISGFARSAPAMPQIALPFARPGTAVATRPAAPVGQVSATGAPSGYRLNKSGYFLKDGSYVAPGTKWVKIRRRNPANAKALRRSLSRVESFGGLVKRTRKSIRKVKSL